MAMDMTLFTLDGKVIVRDNVGLRMVAEAEIDADTTRERLRIICNKVLKYLMTAKGSDAFDASYGGTALQTRNIGEAMLPEIRIRLLQDIADCTVYIKEAEQAKTRSVMERLDKIELVSLDYDRKNNPTGLRVRLHISTTYGNSAVIEA